MLRAHRQQRRRFAQRREPRFSPDTIRIALWSVVIFASGLGMIGFVLNRAEADRRARIDPVTLCSTYAASPKASLMLVDQTDPLARDDAANFTAMVRSVASSMRRNDRLTIVPFDGDLGRTPSAIFDTCSPGNADEVDDVQEGRRPARERFKAKFMDPLTDQMNTLMKSVHSPRSPIARQIERIATSPAIGWQGRERELILITDGLENTDDSPIYADGTIKLPTLTPGLLKGIKVKYYLLANAKRSDLQLNQVQAAWKAWLEAEGATVEIYAPGFVPPRG